MAEEYLDNTALIAAAKCEEDGNTELFTGDLQV